MAKLDNNAHDKKRQVKKNYLTTVSLIGIIIVAVVVVSVVLYNLGIFSSRVTIQQRIQNGPIVNAQSSQQYTTTLNSSSYKVYEINIPQNKTSNYVYSEISYNISSNSTIIYSLLLSENQLSLFQKGTRVINPIFFTNKSDISNAFIENTSLTNVSLFLVVFPKNTTSKITFNYSLSYITYSHSFKALSVPNGDSGIIRAGQNYTQELPFEVTNSSTIYSYGLSNQTLIYSIFDNSTGRTVYSSKPATVIENKSNQYVSINLTKGVYSIIISNYHNSSTSYDYWYTESPYIINPYFGISNIPAEGLASYGILNKSGTLSTYNINTSALMGFLNLSSLYAYSSSQTSSSHYISAQLNGVLVVTNKNGTIQTYFVQNVADILSSDRTFYLFDNVWNSGLTNQTIKGDGYVVYDNAAKEPYYVFVTNSSFYNYPLTLALQSVVSVDNNTGVNLNECYQPLQNGQNISVAFEGYCYDTMFINDSNVQSAEFVISGSNYPIGLIPYYDAEFVIGGGFNGSLSTIQNINAKLGLYYYDNSTTAYVQFPSYYSFARNTAEELSNVNVNYNSNYAALKSGTNVNSYLGTSSKFMPLISINSLNLTEDINYTNYSPENYSSNLNGFSTSAGNYYNYGVITTEGSNTCTITGIKSLTPQVYLTGVNVTLPYTITSGSTLNWQFTVFTNPFYNYSGDLNILEYENCN